MNIDQSRLSTIVTATCAGFFAGVITVAVIVRFFPPGGRESADGAPVAGAPAAAEPSSGGGRVAPEPSFTAIPARVTPSGTPAIAAEAVAELRARQLDLPVRGLNRKDLRDSFLESRDATRVHDAIDILAPRNTPILAVEDGTIAKLFESKAGGTTIYQFDPTTRYVYYYAHLERYADGLSERQTVRRGQVLGYVGTSGNAPKNTPHLHFAIMVLTDKKQWWKGDPINPFEVLK